MCVSRSLFSAPRVAGGEQTEAPAEQQEPASAPFPSSRLCSRSSSASCSCSSRPAAVRAADSPARSLFFLPLALARLCSLLLSLSYSGGSPSILRAELWGRGCWKPKLSRFGEQRLVELPRPLPSSFLPPAPQRSPCPAPRYLFLSRTLRFLGRGFLGGEKVKWKELAQPRGQFPSSDCLFI